MSDEATRSKRTATVADSMAGCADACSAAYCRNCDLLVGLPGLHVLDVDIGERVVTVTAESASAVMGCRTCGVLAVSHGRRDHMPVDAPCFGRPVRVVWRKRTWTCPESLCPVGVFTEQADQVAAPRALLTVRACWWAVGQTAVSMPASPGWPGSSAARGRRRGGRESATN